MSTLMRIPVDFNSATIDQDRRVMVPTMQVRGFFRDGVRVIVHEDDLEVEATLEFVNAYRGWWARPDWSTRRNLPVSPERKINESTFRVYAALAAEHQTQGRYEEAEDIYRDMLSFAESRQSTEHLSDVFNASIAVIALEPYVAMLRNSGRIDEASIIASRVSELGREK